MDAADEQRILHILRAAQGDPALLALVPLDLTFAEATQAERERLRQALLAASVPHWFDTPFLAALLATSVDEADVLMRKLQRLTNVETFPSRGAGACNVHEASRLALREHIRLKHPFLWQTYAQRAHDYLATGKENHERIEALFHLFAANSESAIDTSEAVFLAVRENRTNWSSLCIALTELSNSGWLTPAALVEVRRIKLWYRLAVGEAQLEPEAVALLEYAKLYAHPSRIADATQLLEQVRAAFLNRICETYWQPLYQYAQKLGYADYDAADLTQDFMVLLLGKPFFQPWAIGAGSLRNFLLASFQNFIHEQGRKQLSMKRGNGKPSVRLSEIEDLAIESEGGDKRGNTFDRVLAASMMDQALAMVRANFIARGKFELFESLKSSHLESPNYSEQATKLGIREAQFRVHVQRFRSSFREALTDLVRNSVAPGASEEDIRTEALEYIGLAFK